jgi:hypothetical protein
LNRLIGSKTVAPLQQNSADFFCSQLTVGLIRELRQILPVSDSHVGAQVCGELVVIAGLLRFVFVRSSKIVLVPNPI